MTPIHVKPLGAVCAIVICTVSACGDDAVPTSSNRGSGSGTELTSVENAFIVPRFVPGSCAIQIGDAASLSFTATNNRNVDSESLLDITSPDVSDIVFAVPTPVEIAPDSTISAGQPIENVGGNAGPDQPFTVSIRGLKESARPGTSIDVSFLFERQGDITMRVPIEACPSQQ